jgi:M6 family metalloprotease-like protein
VKKSRRLALVLAAFALAGPSVRAAEDTAPRAVPLRPSEARRIDARLPSPEEGWIGITLPAGREAPVVRSVDAAGPAHRAGIRAGDRVEALDGVVPPDALAVAWMLRVRTPGDVVQVEVLRSGTRITLEVDIGRRPGESALVLAPRFRLAVVPLSLSDRVRAANPDDATLDRTFFSRDTHHGPLPSGRTLRGSLRDYWRDHSHGRLDVVGHVFPTVAVPASARVFAEQAMGAGPDTLYARAIAALLDREGSGALAEFDGVAFLYPGPIGSAPRRGLWPHRAMVRVAGRVIPYFVKNLDAAGEPEPIGVLCHEFGHLLGLPDQYGAAHRTGVGDFCVMALGHRGGGSSGADRPFGLCAWCRTVLRWTEPVAVDPTAQQDLVLAPWNKGVDEVLLVPGANEGEHFLLENRPRTGWDADLPGAGLLVWRAGAPLRPSDPPESPWLDLVEAHGILAPDASLLRPDEIPFPGTRGGVLSEETHPGRAGSLRLSWIRRMTGDMVAFRLGERGPFKAPAARDADLDVDEDGYATLRDPITGLDTRVRVFLPGTLDPHDARKDLPPPSVDGD